MFPIVFLGLLNIEFGATFNDFPSLMIANASMAVVIERPFFEMKAVKKWHTTRRAYEKKLEAFVKSINEAAKYRGTHNGVGIEISVFQETSVNLGRDHDCPRLPINNGISIPIVETGEELPQIFLDLRITRVLKWKKINVLHDRVFERDTIGRVLRALSGEIPNNSHLGLASKCLFSPRSANDSSSMKKHIVETLVSFPPRRRTDDHFIVIVAHDVAPLIIESARSLGLLRPESQWLFVLPDSSEDPSNVTDFHKLLAEGDNISFIYNDTNFNEDCQAGLQCHAKEMVRSLVAGIEDTLIQEIELYDRVTAEEFDEVRMTKAERCQKIVSFIRKDLFDTVRANEGTKKCNICMMWKIMAGITWGNSFGGKNGTEVHELINAGHWTPGSGTSMKDVLFPHTKYGFRNKTLPIVTYHNPPWQYATKSKETGYHTWDGLVFDILNELSKKLNFTYKLMEMVTTTSTTSDQETRIEKSERHSNHSDTTEFVRALTSSGERIPETVTKLVHDGKVLMAACASTITERLKSSINFTVPISVQTYGLIATRPKPLSRAMLFASPYTTESWACLAGGIVLTGPILYLVHRYSPTRLDDIGPSSVGLNTPARCLWYIYGAVLQQGGMHLPKNDGARLIVGTWWLVVMVVVATYSGSLVAFLTFPRMDESISSVDDLLRHRDTLTWSLPSNSFLVEYLTSGKSGPYDGLLGDDYHSAERHDKSNYESLVGRVKEGTHVIVDWTSSLRMLMRMDNPLTNDGICYFSIGTETFAEEPIALLLPSDSPYLTLINTELTRMSEAGLIGKWTTDRMPMRDQCWEESGMTNQANNHKVDVWDMQGIFFVLFLGYFVAVVFLAWEFFSHHRKLAKERKIIRPFLS